MYMYVVVNIHIHIYIYILCEQADQANGEALHDEPDKVHNVRVRALTGRQ